MERRRWGHGLVWIAGLAWVAYMSWNVIFSDHGYLVYQQEAEQVRKLERELDQAKAARERLASEVLRLRGDPEALEELIHRELGYVHPDEWMVIRPISPKAYEMVLCTPLCGHICKMYLSSKWLLILCSFLLALLY